jgi:hypothetical protein
MIRNTVMLNKMDKIARRVMSACKGNDLFVAFAALENVMEGVLEQIPDRELRNHIAIRLIYMILTLPVFADLGKSNLPEEAADIADLSNDGERDAAALAAIKVFAGISRPLSVDAHTPPQLALLRQPFVAAAGDELERFASRLYEHSSSAIALICGLPHGDVQLRTLLIYIHGLLVMGEFKDIDTAKLKDILRLVSTVPDAEFREIESLDRIDEFLASYPTASGHK